MALSDDSLADVLLMLSDDSLADVLLMVEIRTHFRNTLVT